MMMTSQGETGGASPPPRPRFFRTLFTVLVAVLVVWFLGRVLRDVGLSRLESRLLGADPALAGLAVVLTIGRFLVLARRWEVLARREAPVGFRQIAPVTMAGAFVGLVTPLARVAGPILKAYYLSRETGRPRTRFYGTLLADQASNFTVFAVAAAFSGAWFPMAASSRVSPAVGGAMLAALIGGLTVAGRMLRDVHRGGAPRVGRLLRRLLRGGEEENWKGRTIAWSDDVVRALSVSVIGSGAWWPALALSAAAFLLVVLVQALSLAAVGVEVSLAEATFVIAGAGVLQMMAAAPGGPGVAEASLIAVLLAVGVDAEPAAAGALLARLVNYAVLLPWGGFAFFRLQRRYGAPPDDSGPAND